MPAKSQIGWLWGPGYIGASWNIGVVGCDRVSPGCDRCYAETLFQRFHMYGDGLFSPARRMKDVMSAAEYKRRLEWPLRQKQPTMIFTNSMTDLLHSVCPDDDVLEAFDVMGRAWWHIFIVLTKRAGRLRYFGPKLPWGDNVWAGVSIENDLFVPRAGALVIGAAKAKVRLVSYEPALGPVPRLAHYFVPEPYNQPPPVNWVLIGAESGPGCRPMDIAWVEQIADAAWKAGVDVFFKQTVDTRTGRKNERPILPSLGRPVQRWPYALDEHRARLVALGKLPRSA